MSGAAVCVGVVVGEGGREGKGVAERFAANSACIGLLQCAALLVVVLLPPLLLLVLLLHHSAI